MVAMTGGDCMEDIISSHQVSSRMIDDTHKMEI